MKTATVLRLSTAAILVLSTFSCFGPFMPERTGNLDLRMSNGLAASARGLFPDLDMAASSYELSGDGPGTESFTDTITGTTYERDDLAVGPWTITATAKNAATTPIGSGSVEMVIASGADAEGTIVIAPFNGVGYSGTMAIDLSWPGGSIASPAITATLTDPAGTPEAISFTIDGNTALYDRVEMTTGYWYLSAVLMDGTTEVYWIEESVRIVHGQETAAMYALTTDDVEKTVSKPTFSSTAGTYGSSQSITLSVPNDPGAAIMYTNNGAEPTLARGTEYTAPFTLNSTQTIRAKAFMPGWNDSATATAAYTITGSFATPMLDPPPGVYYDPIDELTITCSTPASGIYYTDDGMAPAPLTPPQYSTPLTISTTTTIRALSCNFDGSIYSDEAGGEYKITGHVAAPTFNVPAGTYTTEQSVTLSCTTPGATIHYTTDGSTPTETHGTEYLAPINVNLPMTVKAVAFLADWDTSDVVERAYAFQSPPPSFSPDAGTYNAPQDITLSCPGSQIRYTIDLSEPTTETGTLYESTPVPIPATRTLKAIAYHTGWQSSAVVSKLYSMKCATPTFSPVPGDVASGTYITISSVTPDTEVHYTTNGNTPTRSDPTDQPQITVTTTLKAVAFRELGKEIGWATSDVATGTFSVGGEYNVVFEGNGADGGSMPPQTIIFGQTEALNTNGFTRTGYSFDGWATTSGGTFAYADGANYQMNTQGATLWAKWAPNDYQVTFNGNGATAGSMLPQTITFDTTEALTTNAFTRTVHTFMGWSSTSEGTVEWDDGDPYTMITEGDELFAVWDLDQALWGTAVWDISEWDP